MLKIGFFKFIPALAVLFLLGCSPAAETIFPPPTTIALPVASQTPVPAPTATLVPAPGLAATLSPSPAPLLRSVPMGELPCTFSTNYLDLPPGSYLVYRLLNDGCSAGECQQTNVFSLATQTVWPLVRGVACSPKAHSFSADGHLMAFVDQTNGKFQLYLHDFTTQLTTAYVSAWDCSAPALSPDGTKIAVSCSDKLRVISAAEGRDLLPDSTGFSAALNPAWSPDGSHLAYLGSQEYMSGGLVILDAGSFLSAGGFRHDHFQKDFVFAWSPDSQKIGMIYLNRSGETEYHELRARDLHGKVLQTYPLKVVPTLGEMQSNIAWLPDGRFIFGKVKTIFVLSPDGTIRKLLDEASVCSSWLIPAR